IDSNFSSIDPAIEVQRTLTAMEFDLSKIDFDTEDRRNKYPSPICFFVVYLMIYEYSIRKRAHILIYNLVFMKQDMPCTLVL
ncbi:MAG: hypothetical protein ACJ72F_05385, partial [Nitrososphaeraceae archaeon]